MSARLLPAALLGLALAAPAAGAATAPCRPDGAGPTCQVWTARVVAVNDGDTIDVVLAGSRRVQSVRFIGVQAMEQTRYSSNPAKRRGQCHALQATNLVERLIRQGRKRVRLAAQVPKRDSTGRLLRSVAVRIGGRWRDIGEIEMARGVTLWMHNTVETAWNERYNRLGQRAAQRRIGIWDPATCGAGPDQGAQLQVWVMSDPVGEDTVDINSEYMRVRNRGARPVDLSHWWIRDSGLRRFTFPRGTVLGPGRTLTVHSGRGRSTGDTFYWGLPGTVFENSANGGGAGDGAYLFDPQGDLRAYMVYPCLVACSDPNQGAVRVTAYPRDERVTIENVAGRPVDLYGYELRLPGGYAFDQGSVLAPGETMTVDVGGDPADDSRLVRHIGIAGPYLPNRGGAVSVTTFDEIVLDCDAWGSGRC